MFFILKEIAFDRIMQSVSFSLISPQSKHGEVSSLSPDLTMGGSIRIQPFRLAWLISWLQVINLMITFLYLL